MSTDRIQDVLTATAEYLKTNPQGDWNAAAEVLLASTDKFIKEVEQDPSAFTQQERDFAAHLREVNASYRLARGTCRAIQAVSDGGDPGPHGAH